MYRHFNGDGKPVKGSWIIRLCTIIVLFSLINTGCREPMILEYEHLLTSPDRGRKVTVIRRNEKIRLRISGHIGHSALAVERTASERKSDGLHIYTYLVLVRDGKRSGALEHEIAVPEDVNRVYFGKKKRLIWERNQGGN